MSHELNHTEAEMRKRLQEAFPGAEMTLKDLTGTQDHWRLSIASKAFAGKSLVQQHQLVYRALGDLMKKEVHALALETKAL